MQASHLDAEQRYEQLRKQALELSQQHAPATIRFSVIDAAARIAAETWMDAPGRHVEWDWTEGLKILKFRHPKRFEVAVWQANDLIAMSFGRPTYSGARLRLDLVEARPARAPRRFVWNPTSTIAGRRCAGEAQEPSRGCWS